MQSTNILTKTEEDSLNEYINDLRLINSKNRFMISHKVTDSKVDEIFKATEKAISLGQNMMYNSQRPESTRPFYISDFMNKKVLETVKGLQISHFPSLILSSSLLLYIKDY
jgi:hypothetical protein